MVKTVMSPSLNRVLLRVQQLISVASSADDRRRELVDYRIGQLSEAFSTYKMYEEDRENFVKEMATKLKY